MSSGKPYIDPAVPRRSSPESRGTAADRYAWFDQEWLMDTEVRYALRAIRGRWHVYMLFLALEPTIKLVVRRLSHYHSRQRAETYARIFQRGIRKDARGTLKRKQHAYHICAN